MIERFDCRKIWQGRSLEREGWEIRLTPRAGRVHQGDLPVGSAVALLASILVSPAGRPRDEAASRDLVAALRVLRRSIPGFAQAMGAQLAQSASGQTNEEADRCLRAVLAEPLSGGRVHETLEDSQCSPSRVFNLGSHYEKNR